MGLRATLSGITTDEADPLLMRRVALLRSLLASGQLILNTLDGGWYDQSGLGVSGSASRPALQRGTLSVMNAGAPAFHL